MAGRVLKNVPKVVRNVNPLIKTTVTPPLIKTTVNPLIGSMAQGFRNVAPGFRNLVGSISRSVTKPNVDLLRSNLNRAYTETSKYLNSKLSPLSEGSKVKTMIDLFVKGPFGALESNGATITKYLTDNQVFPQTIITNIGTIANALRWITTLTGLYSLYKGQQYNEEDIQNKIEELNRDCPEGIGIQIDKNILDNLDLKNEKTKIYKFVNDEIDEISKLDISDIHIINILLKIIEEKNEFIKVLKVELCKCDRGNSHCIGSNSQEIDFDRPIEEIDGGYFSKTIKKRKRRTKRTRRKSLKKLF